MKNYSIFLDQFIQFNWLINFSYNLEIILNKKLLNSENHKIQIIREIIHSFTLSVNLKFLLIFVLGNNLHSKMQILTIFRQAVEGDQQKFIIIT